MALDLPIDLGTSNYDLNDPFTLPPAQAKNFPVGLAELGVMVFVGALALFALSTSRDR